MLHAHVGPQPTCALQHQWDLRNTWFWPSGKYSSQRQQDPTKQIEGDLCSHKPCIRAAAEQAAAHGSRNSKRPGGILPRARKMATGGRALTHVTAVCAVKHGFLAAAQPIMQPIQRTKSSRECNPTASRWELFSLGCMIAGIGAAEK
jgi:hypothetical protein